MGIPSPLFLYDFMDEHVTVAQVLEIVRGPDIDLAITEVLYVELQGISWKKWRRSVKRGKREEEWWGEFGRDPGM